MDELTASLLDPKPVRDTIDILSFEARSALMALVESHGKIEWALFARRYGQIREMGAGKRDREKPYLKPASSAEALFYRGLMDRAFFDTDKGAQEFAYIPDDLYLMIKRLDDGDGGKEQGLSQKFSKGGKDLEPLGRPATPVEKAYELPASDHVLDDATTLLAAIRIGKPGWQTDLRLKTLLIAAKLIKKDVPQAEAVKKFLEVPRPEALNILYSAWLDSQVFDELRLIPGLICEGEWTNDARATRRFLLDLIASLPKDKWQSLSALLRDIKSKRPDFQRPAGDYDSWFIKRESDGQYLRGFAYWDQVDGALVKYFIQILRWFGKVDLASPHEGEEFSAFRVKSVFELKDEKGKIVVSSNGRISVMGTFSRAARYQLARFCEWDQEKGGEYFYRVTAQSLKYANEQGLKAEQLLSLLVKHTNGSVPPVFVKALKRWEANGAEARVENLLVLRVGRPEAMEEIRNSKAGKFLGEVLSPTAVIVKEGAVQKVIATLAELGLLADVKLIDEK